MKRFNINFLENNCKNFNQIFLKRRIWLFIAFLFIGIYGAAQNDSIILKGKLIDANDFPVLDEKIGLKLTSLATYTDNNGYFELKVPFDKNQLVLVYNDSTENKIEYNIDYDKIKDFINLKLNHSNELYSLTGEVIYVKPTFKERVIRTITWPYRKIRSTFFDN